MKTFTPRLYRGHVIFRNEPGSNKVRYYTMSENGQLCANTLEEMLQTIESMIFNNTDQVMQFEMFMRGQITETVLHQPNTKPDYLLRVRGRRINIPIDQVNIAAYRKPDAYGHAILVRKFATREEARQFTTAHVGGANIHVGMYGADRSAAVVKFGVFHCLTVSITN